MLFRRKITKEKIDNKIKKFISRFGNTPDIKRIQRMEKDMDIRERFFELFFKISFSKGEERKRLIKEAKKIADKIPEFKGWPEKTVKFWDVEAMSWKTKVPSFVRLFIRKELLKKVPFKKLNLALGSGSCPYIEDSVLVDFSSEMLKAVEPSVKFRKKIVHDLDKGKLPFGNNSFDSVTMVFVVNYLGKIEKVLKEVFRILKKRGKLIIVQSAKMLDDWYVKKEKKQWKTEELSKLLKKIGFKVKVEKKKIKRTQLVFVEAIK
jgi:SAM-dependent methyltransferase